MLDMPSISGLVRSHILKELIHEANALQEIISMSTTRKNVCEGIIKMLSPQSIGASLTQHIIPDFEKDATHVD